MTQHTLYKQRHTKQTSLDCFNQSYRCSDHDRLPALAVMAHISTKKY